MMLKMEVVLVVVYVWWHWCAAIIFKTRNAHFRCLFPWLMLHPFGFHSFLFPSEIEKEKGAFKNYAAHRNLNDEDVVVSRVNCKRKHCRMQTLLHRYHFAFAHWIMSMSIYLLPIFLHPFQLHVLAILISFTLSLSLARLFVLRKMANYFKNLSISRIDWKITQTNKRTHQSVELAEDEKSNMNDRLTISLNDLPAHFH